MQMPMTNSNSHSLARTDEVATNHEAHMAYQQALKYGEDLRRIYQAEKARRLELEIALQTLNAVFNSTPNGLAVLNDSFVIQQVNPVFAHLLELPESYVLQQRIDAVLPSTLLLALQDAANGQHSNHMMMELYLDEPIKRVLQASFARLMAGGQRGWVVSIDDVTEHRQLEFQKIEFVNIASHELRTPLTQVIGHATMLQEELDTSCDEQASTYLEGILQGSWRLKERIDELLRFASILGGNDQPRALTEVDLPGLIQTLIDDTASQIEEKQVTVSLEHDTVPLLLMTNARLLGSALAEVLGNAIRFNKPGGSVSIRVRLSDRTGLIEVEDTGVGIPQSDMDQIFEPFYQVEDHRTRRVGGLGLGLSIARHSIEELGGSLTIESALNEGTTVTLRVPNAL